MVTPQALWLVVLFTLYNLVYSDFRYGQITWSLLETDGSDYTVEFDVIIGISQSGSERTPVDLEDPLGAQRQYTVGDTYGVRGVHFEFGDGESTPLASPVVKATGCQFASGCIFFIHPVFNHTFTGAGPFHAGFKTHSPNPIRRWPGIRNNDVLQVRMNCTVDLSGGNTASPLVALPWQVQMPLDPAFSTRPRTRLIAHDADGDTVTFSLATPEQLGDAYDWEEYARFQSSSQPENFAIDPITGLITFFPDGIVAGAKDHWNTQIFLTDSKGGSSVVDFIIHTKNFNNIIPEIGGESMSRAFTSSNWGTLAELEAAAEEVLINQRVEFSIEGFSTNNIGILKVHGTEPYDIVNETSSTYNETNAASNMRISTDFEYTGRRAGLRPLCFWTVDDVGEQSDIYCIFHLIVDKPKIYYQFYYPTIQVVDKPIKFWFVGRFLGDTDRVAVVMNGTTCEDLQDDAGQPVTEAMPGAAEASTGKIKTIPNLTQTRVIVRSPQLGWNKICYKLNAAGDGVPWVDIGYDLEPRPAPQPFKIKDIGPYVADSFVSLHVDDRWFRYLIDGVELQRFDKVAFIKPDSGTALPPGLTANVWDGRIPDQSCKDLGDSTDDHIKQIKDIQPIGVPDYLAGFGFVAGNERAEWPAKHTTANMGDFLCYKPKSDLEWRLLTVVQKPEGTGPFEVVEAFEERPGTVNITLNGVRLEADDTIQAFAQRNDCADMGQPSAFSDDEQDVILLDHSPADPIHNNVNFEITGNSTAGINFFTLCYRHKGKIIRVDEVPFREKPLNYIGIPDPLIATPDYPWVDYKPTVTYVNISTELEFTGYGPYSWTSPECKQCGQCDSIWVKVAEHGSCVGNAAGGEERVLNRDRRASFALAETGSFRICIKHRIDWEEVARDLIVVEQPDWAESTPFNGHRACNHWVEHTNQLTDMEICGCYVTQISNETETRWVNVDSHWTVPAVTATKYGVNQGCCEDKNSVRTEGGSVGEGSTQKWGYCTLNPTVQKIPFHNMPDQS